MDLSNDDIAHLSRVFNGGANLGTARDYRINEWLKSVLAASAMDAPRPASEASAKAEPVAFLVGDDVSGYAVNLPGLNEGRQFPVYRHPPSDEAQRLREKVIEECAVELDRFAADTRTQADRLYEMDSDLAFAEATDLGIKAVIIDKCAKSIRALAAPSQETKP